MSVSGKGPARPDKSKSGGPPARGGAPTRGAGQQQRSGAARDGRTRAGAGAQRPPIGQAKGKGGAGRSAAVELLADHRRRQKMTWLIVAAAVIVIGGVVAGILATQSPGKSAASTTSSSSSTSSTSSTTTSLPLASLSSLGTLVPAGSAGSAGPEGVPIPKGPPLAGTSNKALGNVVDGIECQTNEQTIYHVHAHLTIYVDGKAQQVPYGIGIPEDQATNTQAGPFVQTGACFYWLHTHASDGIIHIESPTQRIYTLGDFFAIWGEPLSSTQVGPDKGTVVAIYDGKVYTGDPADIPLTPHAEIQLEVGKPLVSPIGITWPSGL